MQDFWLPLYNFNRWVQTNFEAKFFMKIDGCNSTFHKISWCNWTHWSILTTMPLKNKSFSFPRETGRGKIWERKTIWFWQVRQLVFLYDFHNQELRNKFQMIGACAYHDLILILIQAEILLYFCLKASLGMFWKSTDAKVPAPLDLTEPLKTFWN